jgi:hypothetical protein
MKKMRCLLLSGLLLMLCAFLFAGCADKTPEPPNAASGDAYNDMTSELTKNGSIKPGANIRQYVDEDGNKRIEYENPDGSGGGGVALD